ncbi:MAG: AAA family ATPase [Desulfovibrio sp.]|uniref:UvrD-helicase domain-containing protein n=1 Tax=Desulfovibrio sp. TaxID=885 RepID=UPI00135EEF59|nr:UvrD-helicase domain-containing protein [Desulfovibrio sp.]MTJ92646.1 AAA family ATPase [Desulfovibrio sp.]
MKHLRQVKASAGSGKTYELTRCFLQRLVESGPPASASASSACVLSPGGAGGWGDILAITFTNAAAAEMRDRVIRQLKSTALGQTAEGLPFSPEQAARWVDVIMRDMGALNIRTIDSLLHLIVRAAALELDLHPDFQPVFATEEVLTPYLDALLEQAWQGNEVMRALLRDVYRALAWRENSTGFLAGEKLLNQLRGLLDDVLLGRFDDVSPADVLHKRLSEVESLAVIHASNFHRVALAEGLSFNKNALAAVEAIAAKQCKASAFLSKASASELFLKKPVVSDEVQKAYEAFARAACVLVDTAPMLRQALGHAPVLLLARMLVEAFSSNQQQEGSLPGLLIPHKARLVLENENGVPEALCRMGSRLTHFLVDEFQDTSREQWFALRPLLEEALSRGGSLTWVGDVKQSIYGWRGGEPELFDGVFDDEGLTALAPDSGRDNLPFNWRSRREIVQHNNAIFGPLAKQDVALQVMTALLPSSTPPDICTEAARGLVRAFEGTEQQCPQRALEGGLVHVETVHSLDADALNEDVLERLCALLHEDIRPGHPWADVLILVRSNDKATLVADRLIREDIPVITENSLRLANHPLVVQTVAMLSFLDNPEDDIAFMSLVCGSIIREHPEAAELARQDIAGWCASSGRGPVFQRFKNRWPQLWQRLFAPFHSQSGLMTPYDMILEWYARMDVARRYPEAETFLRRFMEVLHSAEEKGLATLPTFLEHWRAKSGEEKVPMPENMDAVRVMTIHKSKGLEAPVVVVPWTDLRARMGSSTVLVEREGLRMVVSNRKSLGTPYHEEMARQCRENVHLLYVAFTRARDSLYVLRTSTRGGRGSTTDALDLLMAEAGYTAPYAVGDVRETHDGAPEPQVAAAAAAELSANPKAAKGQAENVAEVAAEQMTDHLTGQTGDAFEADWRPMQWLPRLKIFRNPLAGFSFKAEDRGSFLHLCLEHLHITGNPQGDAQAALNFGLGHFSLPVPDEGPLRQNAAAALEWFASQPQAARWLQTGWPEHSLMDAEGQLLRVDLLVHEPWGPLVLDYKSGQPEADHVEQLQTYLACLEASGSCAPGSARGLLVYLDLRRFQLVEAQHVSPLAERCGDLLPAQEKQA